MAQEADGQLTVLHVVEHEFQNAADMVSMTLGDFLEAREEALRRRLQDAVRARPSSAAWAVDDAWKALARGAAHRRRNDRVI